jgi:fumarate reductase subunit C
MPEPFTTHHSPLTKEYIRPIPATWWLQNPAYTKFILRELSSVFIAGYCVFLMVLMYRAKDAESFAGLYEALKSPLSIVLHLIVLAFAVYNSVTAMHAAPRIVKLYKGDEKVPDNVVVGIHYGMWALASLVVIVLAMAVA